MLAIILTVKRGPFAIGYFPEKFTNVNFRGDLEHKRQKFTNVNFGYIFRQNEVKHTILCEFWPIFEQNLTGLLC